MRSDICLRSLYVRTYRRGELLFAGKFGDDSSSLTDFINKWIILKNGKEALLSVRISI